MKNNKTGTPPSVNISDQLHESSVSTVQNASLVEQRQDQIGEAALELFLEKGFASTTIRDICARSGVNQASIYDYFANKNDILRRLLNKLWFHSEAPNLADLLDQDGPEDFEQRVAYYLRESWTRKRKGTLLSYRTVPHLTENDRRAMRAREELLIDQLAIRLRDRAGLADTDPQAQIMANLIVYLAGFAPLRDWLHQDIDNELIVDTIAAGVDAMVERLANAGR